jgi:16S rRNA (uracil1498-N3)-methyltransferase
VPHFFARREGELVEITGVDARHLAGPLRARPGELIKVVEPEGRLLSVRLDLVSSTAVRGRVVEDVAHEPEPHRQVRLAVAMLPASALEQVLARCTEAGAAGFLLVQARRSQARGLKPERWAAICREAAMLAGRLRVPQVSGGVGLAEAWTGAVNPWMLDRSGTARLVDLDAPDQVDLFVGPEGGWAPEEVALAGERVVRLALRNMRAETAALVALAVALRGD